MYHTRFSQMPDQQQLPSQGMYQPMDMTPRYPMGMQLQMPAGFAEPLVNGEPFVAQGPDRSSMSMQGFGMEPLMSDNSGMLDFFGLGDGLEETSPNNLRSEEFESLRKEFGHGSEGFDGLQPILENEPYTSSTAESMATQSSRDDGSFQLNNGMADFQTQQMQQLEQQQMRETQRMQQLQHQQPLVMPRGPMPTRSRHVPISQVQRQFQRGQDPNGQVNNIQTAHHSIAPPNFSQLSLQNPPMQQPMMGNQAALNAAMQQNPILSIPPPNLLALNMQDPMQMMQPPNSAIFYQSQTDDQPVEPPSYTNGMMAFNAALDKKPMMLQESPTLKQPNSGMAARRPRRPPMLSSTNRSSSYNANMPTSPRANTQVSSPDHVVRRVKSSGVVLGGRITKGAGAAQRSPLPHGFTGGIDSPRIDKKMSMQSLDAVAAASGIGNSMPITPSSPMDFLPTPTTSRSHNMGRSATQQTVSEAGPEAPVDPAWANVPDSFENSMFPSQTGTPQSGSVHGGMSFQSPPRTPMEYTLPFQQPPAQFMQTPQGQMLPPQLNGAWSGSIPQSTPQFMQQMTQQSMPQPMALPMQQTMPPVIRQTTPQQMPASFSHSRPPNLGPLPPFAPNIDLDSMPMNFEPQFLSQSGARTPGEDVMSMFEASRKQSGMTNASNVSPGTTGPGIRASPDIPSGFSRFQQQPQFMQQPQYPSGMPQQYFTGAPVSMNMNMQQMYMPQMTMSGSAPMNFAESIASISPTQLVGSSTGMQNFSPTGTYGNGATPEPRFHTYEPKEPADSSKLPPKNRTSSTPKQYSFQNTGPGNYSTSPRDTSIPQ